MAYDLKQDIAKNGLKAFKFCKKYEKSAQGSAGILRYYKKSQHSPSKRSRVLKEAREFLVEPYNILKSTLQDEYMKIVYKIGLESPFLSQHEHDIAVTLEQLATFLPNFMKSYDIIKNVLVDVKSKYTKNPFVNTSMNVRSKTSIYADVLLLEYISSKMSFDTMIYMRRKTQDIRQQIDSLINQIMFAILIAQDKLEFVHNDLHFSNILVCECLPNTVLLYKFYLQNELQYGFVKTYGVFPVIIDYGFSYTRENNILYTGIHHNHKGYINYTFDKFADMKTLLARISENGYSFYDGNGDDFRKDVEHNIFTMNIDQTTGWDVNKFESASKRLVHRIQPIIKNILCKFDTDAVRCKTVFTEKEYEIVDIIGSLIILPLQEKSYDNLEDCLESFFKEWLKIEKWIDRTAEKLYILTNIVDYIRHNIMDISDSPTDGVAYDVKIADFVSYCYKHITKIGGTVDLTDVNFTALYINILYLADCFEGILHKHCTAYQQIKDKEYKKLKYTSAYDMYTLIEPYITHPINIEKNDYIVILDACEEKTSAFIIDDDVLVRKLQQSDHNKKAELIIEYIDTL